MKRFIRLLFTFLLSFPVIVNAEGTWEQHTTPSHIKQLLFDDGMIWCATSGGLYCLNIADGKFTRYTTLDGLADNYIRVIYSSSDGSKWVATRGGLSRFKDGSFTNYSEEDGMASYIVTIILEDAGGNIFAGSNWGLSYFDGEQWTAFSADDGLPSTRILTLYSDINETVWVGTVGGLASYENGIWQVNEVPEYGTDVIVEQFTEDNNNVLWAIIEDQLAFLGDSGWQFFHTEYDWVRMMLFDHENNIWFINRGHLIKYQDSTFTDYMDENGPFHFESFDSITIDQQGNIWLVNDSIVLLDDISYTYITNNQKFNVMSHMISPDGTFWVGSYTSGLFRFDGNTWTHYQPENCPVDNSISDMVLDNAGNLWCWFRYKLDNVSWFDGNTWTTISSNSVPEVVLQNTYVADKNGLLWRRKFGSYAPVEVKTNDEWIPMYNAGTNIYNIIADRNGDLWITGDNKVSRWDGADWSYYYTGIEFPPGPKGLLTVSPVTEDADGILWFGHNAGITRYEGNTWTSYNNEDIPECTSLNVSTVAVDSQNTKWFGTFSEGVFMFDGEKWMKLKACDGLCSNRIHKIIAGPDGTIWFGTNNGIAILRDYTPSQVTTEAEENRFTLLPPYPNPFNILTTISYRLAWPSLVELSVYAVSGQKVATLVNDYKSTGMHSVLFNGDGLASGVYFYHIETPGFTETRKMLLVK